MNNQPILPINQQSMHRPNKHVQRKCPDRHAILPSLVNIRWNAPWCRACTHVVSNCNLFNGLQAPNFRPNWLPLYPYSMLVLVRATGDLDPNNQHWMGRGGCLETLPLILTRIVVPVSLQDQRKHRDVSSQRAPRKYQKESPRPAETSRLIVIEMSLNHIPTTYRMRYRPHTDRVTDHIPTTYRPRYRPHADQFNLFAVTKPVFHHYADAP